jgi:hypothetical protein
MLSIFGKPPNQVAVGIYLIVVIAVSYIGMNMICFGFPNFDGTQKGLIAISYAASNLLVLGIGVHAIIRGLRKRS